MNKLLSISLLSLMVLLAAACKQDPQSANGPQTRRGELPLSSGGSTAHPALTWINYVSKNGYLYSGIWVADSDATNQTNIKVATGNTSVNNYQYLCQSWSPTGASIAWQGIHFGAKPDTLFAIDVSVNSHGTPVGSNFRKVYGFPSTSTRLSQLGGMNWSSTTTMGKIAVITTWATGTKNSLCVIPQAGGTPTTIYTSNLSLGMPAWSPDDSRLAVIRYDTGTSSTQIGSSTILIFNTSTWACVDSVKTIGFGCAGSGPYGCSFDWSRSGLNKLAFTIATYGHYTLLYYCDPTTGATPYTNGSVPRTVSWSPNNSSLITAAYGYSTNSLGAYKVASFTTDTTYVGSISAITGIKWKR